MWKSDTSLESVHHVSLQHTHCPEDCVKAAGGVGVMHKITQLMNWSWVQQNNLRVRVRGKSHNVLS